MPKRWNFAESGHTDVKRIQENVPSTKNLKIKMSYIKKFALVLIVKLFLNLCATFEILETQKFRRKLLSEDAAEDGAGDLVNAATTTIMYSYDYEDHSKSGIDSVTRKKLPNVSIKVAQK